MVSKKETSSEMPNDSCWGVLFWGKIDKIKENL
jgi:hypothetical protein